MIVDLKVHVEIVHYKGRKGSNMRPREFFSEFAKVIFLAKDLETYFNMRPRRKGNNRGVREVFAKVNF